MKKFEVVDGVRKFVEGQDVGITRRRVTITEEVSGLVLDAEEFEGEWGRGVHKYALVLYPMEQTEVNGKPNPFAHADCAAEATEITKEGFRRKVQQSFVMHHGVPADQRHITITVVPNGGQ